MSTQWVEVRSCTWLHEAHFVRSVLEAAGIEAVIPNEQTLGVHPSLAPAVGGIRVLVRSDTLEAAEELLGASAIPPAEGNE
jgi:folate-dependent phosphoribosylglycinamide formyltransferase PurN